MTNEQIAIVTNSLEIHRDTCITNSFIQRLEGRNEEADHNDKNAKAYHLAISELSRLWDTEGEQFVKLKSDAVC